MRRNVKQTDKIFLQASYSVHYRVTNRAVVSVEPRPDYFCLFVLDGELSFQLSGETGVMRKGGGLLLDPGTAVTSNAHNSEFLSLSLSSSFVLDCAARTGLVKSGAIVSFRTPVIEQGDRLARLLRNLAEELIDAEAGNEIVIAALIEQILVQLFRHHTNVRRSDELELSRAGLVDRRIRRAIELMHANLNRDLPLGEIAAAAYLSPFHFSRVFKKLTGTTPHAYLATLRATRAQELLAETDLSVTEISSRVGYTSPSHFTKAFRQSTGMTPRAFRSALVISPESRRILRHRPWCRST